MIISILREARTWFRPLLVALFHPRIPWALRWRLLILQPVALLTYSIGKVPYLFSRPFIVEHLPTRRNGPPLRVLVFKDRGVGTGRKLRPLHVDIHGGSFIGGLPENFAPFSDRVARETGAVVVSITYPYAPEHPFPAAIDDVDRTIRWLRENAELRWGADAELMTISGASAGGNLSLAAAQRPECHEPSPTAIKAAVLFYPVLDLRIGPWDKPKPADMPKSDATAVLMPLFDAYAAPARSDHLEDPRLSPLLADGAVLPRRMLMVVAGIDILVKEQMEFRDRFAEDGGTLGRGGRLEVILEEKGFHGYLECKSQLLLRAGDRLPCSADDESDANM